MAKPDPRELHLARKARLVALVLSVTIVLWVLGGWIGRDMDLDARYAFLLDFAALAGFFWALVVTWQIWRARRAR
jgi:di/tricarboxylate transporter